MRAVYVGIRHLLIRQRNAQEQFVRVAESKLPGAGQGVFTNAPAETGTPLCLYPGIFSPGLPLVSSDAMYLGSDSLPSGVDPPESNAYILNLQTTGGYLDGLATKGLTENPHACAHLVNHASREQSNVQMVSFWWHDILGKDSNQEEEINNSSDKDYLYSIPNYRRCDGMPWFFCNNEMFHYDKETTSPCAGAVFVATRDLVENDELYLDYGLQEPLPVWAKGWYKP